MGSTVNSALSLTTRSIVLVKPVTPSYPASRVYVPDPAGNGPVNVAIPVAGSA